MERCTANQTNIFWYDNVEVANWMVTYTNAVNLYTDVDALGEQMLRHAISSITHFALLLLQHESISTLNGILSPRPTTIH